MDENDNMVGMKYVLSLDPRSLPEICPGEGSSCFVSFENQLVELTPMGEMSGTCQTIELVGAIEKIRASYSLN